jgi:hypothetical protein
LPSCSAVRPEGWAEGSDEAVAVAVELAVFTKGRTVPLVAVPEGTRRVVDESTGDEVEVVGAGAALEAGGALEVAGGVYVDEGGV